MLLIMTVILQSLQRRIVKQSIQTVSRASQDTHCTVMTGSVGEEAEWRCMYDLISSRQSGTSDSADNRVYELHCQRVGDLFLGAMYHPLRPLCTTDSLLDYMTACVNEIYCQYPSATIFWLVILTSRQIAKLLKEQG